MKAMIAGCAKLIAGLLVVAVLSGAQCLNLCAISPCGEGSATRSLGPSGKSPCHHNRGSESQSPNNSESCSHQEFVAEMVKGHREEIAKYEKQAASGESKVAKLAEDLLPTLKEHLAMAERLRSGAQSHDRSHN